MKSERVLGAVDGCDPELSEPLVGDELRGSCGVGEAHARDTLAEDIGRNLYSHSTASSIISVICRSRSASNSSGSSAARC